MKNTFIALLIATTLSSCLNFAVRALAYPKWKPHYKVWGGQVFYLVPNAAGGSSRPVEGADPSTFKQLSYEYGKDRYRAYFWERRIKNSDPDSFELLENGYARDKNSIYSGGGVTPGDPGSVVILGNVTYMDKHNVYDVHVWRDSKNNECSELKKVKSESHFRRMGASEDLIRKTRRERAKRGWTPLPR
ncbi:hypothetical protein CSB45_15550 [candidate division KSB3 bacterium]|uniref:DUF4136 domain-containing protein n=1 Tax=candidate division KSB3 bacterium TaxID=2044937 RepID=A0A2G6E0A1_9BACT|nr:MAG: hypothetical protein CSB45_15550 [candidate division KSB3 bacterium]